jgi:photosystem II stability/assembly factor-like uncharacterized protein
VIAFGPDGSLFSINRQGTYKSTDAGRTWTKFAPSPLPYTTIYNDLHVANGGTLIAASGSALLELRNGVWTSVIPGESRTEIFRLAAAASGILAASNHGLLARMGDGSWRNLSSGFRASVYRVAVSPYEPSLVYAAGRDRKFRSDTEHSWKEIGTGSYWITASPAAPNVVYAEEESRIARSSDAGETWTTIEPTLSGDLDFSLDLAVAPSDSSRLYVALLTSGILSSEDGGASWAAVPSNLGSFYNFGGSPADLAVDPSDPSVVYATHWMGLHRTNNAGTTWQRIGYAQSVAVDRQDSSVIYATGGVHRLSRSYDRGTTWVPIPPEDRGIVAVAVDPSVSGVLYASTSMRVYRSDDFGTTWTPLGDGLGPMIRDLDVDVSGHFLYAATSAGVFEYEISAVDVSPLPATARDLQSLLDEVIANGASSRAAFVLPVAGFVQGGSGLFTTDVTISNESATPQNVLIAWLPRDGGGVSLFNLLVPPSAGLSSGHGIPSIAERLGLTGIGTIVAVAVDPTGAFEAGASIDGSATICARGRDRNPVCETIAGVRSSLFAGHPRASADGLRADADFRTNVGIANLDSRPHRYVVTATGERHSESFELVVPPFSLVHRQLPAGDYGPLAVTITTDDPSVPWISYATTIDNRTAAASTRVGVP